MTGTKTRARNRRGEGGRLRTDIIRAAAELLDGGDAAAVTLREVARRVGISSPSIYAHFPDREAIVFAVVEVTFAALREELELALERAGADPADRLRAVCAAYLDFSRRQPERYRVLFGGLWRARQKDLTPVEEGVPGIGSDVFMLLVGALEACRAAGRSLSTDPFADAAALWAALHGAAELRAAAPLFPWPADLLDRLVERLALLTDSPEGAATAHGDLPDA